MTEETTGEPTPDHASEPHVEPPHDVVPAESAAAPAEQAPNDDVAGEAAPAGETREEGHEPAPEVVDYEATVNLTGDSPILQALQDRMSTEARSSDVTRAHLSGLLEALIFASDHPQKAIDLAKAASANLKEVRELLDALKLEYQPRGIQLDEVAGGWVFRTSSAYAPFVRDLTKQKPVRLSRAQVETMAILAYRQPVTRPEIDEIRGVDSGPVLKVLLERDLVRILGKKDEPGRPMIYGTTTAFLEFFGLKSLKDLPTLREFTELTEDSRRVAERELGEVLENAQPVTVEGTLGVDASLAGTPAETVDASELSEADEASPQGVTEGADADLVHDTTPPPGTDPEMSEAEEGAPAHPHEAGEPHEPHEPHETDAPTE